MATAQQIEIATFGAGCFWCLEAALNELTGVKTAISGYMGGHTANPDYRSVCSGNTGHAEVVQVQFAPEQISFATLCRVFFSLHDATQLNRQGNDIGTQYRSVIFSHSPAQQTQATQIIEQLTNEALFDAPIVTELSPATVFHPAEDYHQGYYKQNPLQGYCQFLISPKMAKFRKQFAHLLQG
ncbi:peptide-methionine (S)-S-oxide reductase MsrA [Alishewanella sp. d11]|uniref:peptide-methionine (S)-S-oxide reductase MsrA n=1 Tax=Alishewanella sp. d11 TaxID=3414030 RepID=UPI003BF8B3E0